VSSVYKVIVSLKHKPEEYTVKINLYGENGELLETREYEGIKQLTINSPEVRISRQLSPNPMVLVIDAYKPKIELREKTLLYIIDEEKR